MKRIAPHRWIPAFVSRTQKRYIVGIDEVGYGSWAGPLVVVAAAFPTKMSWPEHLGEDNILDSKRMKTHERRLAVIPVIEQLCVYKKVVEVSPAMIDHHRAVKALSGAIRVAAYSCLEELEDDALVVVDGNPIVGADTSFTYVVKGDTKLHAIAAASIIAKVYHDTQMMRLAKDYPGYGFEKGMGYGTQKHREGLDRLGVCKLHRKSYKPIREMLDGQE